MFFRLIQSIALFRDVLEKKEKKQLQATMTKKKKKSRRLHPHRTITPSRGQQETQRCPLTENSPRTETRSRWVKGQKVRGAEHTPARWDKCDFVWSRVQNAFRIRSEVASSCERGSFRTPPTPYPPPTGDSLELHKKSLENISILHTVQSKKIKV